MHVFYLCWTSFCKALLFGRHEWLWISSVLLLVMFLQAENGADRMDWVNKITGVIASLLKSPFPGQVCI